VTRTAAILGFALVAACAHLAPPTAAPVADDTAAAMRRCIDDSSACPALAKRLEAKLRDRYDASSAHRLAWHMTETLGGSDVSLVGTTITNCRAGHEASCRALWWAIDRLYVAADATVARANDCGLTEAMASAFEPGAR
jgi:hypothetical protein